MKCWRFRCDLKNARDPKPPISKAQDRKVCKWTRASMVQAAFAAVTLTGGVDECQIARLAHRFAGLWISIQKPLFQCNQQAFRDADPGETTGGQGIAIADQSDRFGGGDLLAFSGKRADDSSGRRPAE